MSDAITHFMWGYQRLFCSSVEIGARHVLERLKPALQPQVFLIGIRTNKDERLMPACVQPEVHHWAQSSEFYDVLGDVEAIQSSYAESQMIHSHPVAQEREQRRLFKQALRDAVLRRLERCQNRPADLQVFASIPVQRDGFLIMTLIAVNGTELGKVPALTSRKVRLNEYRSFDVPCSLVEAVMDEILNRANDAILQADAGADLSVLGSTDEILRRAGITFFSGLLHRADQESFAHGAAHVFDAITRLSLMPYEGDDPSGALVFAESPKDAEASLLSLSNPIPLAQLKALRKLLVLANDGLILRCNSQFALSLVRDPAPQPIDGSGGFTVRIVSRGRWIVSLGSVELASIADGYPNLPRPVVDEERLATDLRRLLPSMSQERAATFSRIGGCLATCGHGSLLVIADNASEEAFRLRNDGLPIRPFDLDSEFARTLSKIDGAILCSPDGLCHGVGLILDGPAISSGDRGRGARFNSAMRYVKANPTRCAAVVVSEDGGLDLLPPLKPPLARSLLLARLDELKRLASSPSTPPDRKREADVINWIEEHSFYLIDEQCAQVNAWIRQCDENFRKLSEPSVWIERPPLRPSENFDPSRDLF